MFGRTSVTSTESVSKDKKQDAKKRSKSIDNNDRNFENMISKSLPSWNAVWNFLLQNNNNNNKDDDNEKHKNKDKVTGRKLARTSRSFSDKDDNESLQIKIQSKIAELVKEEETLVKLYKKAADVAREREEELKNKTAVLMGQIEKDKHLMKVIQNTC